MLFMVGSDGEKFKPLVIGKSENPRAFKNVNKDRLPVTYRANKKVWMTSKLFDEWLKEENRKLALRKKKAVLFLDNAPCHPNVALSNIVLKFLPPNTTAATQPLDQGIIKSFKSHYRKAMLTRIVNCMDNAASVEDVVKGFSVFTVIQMIDKAWDSVTESTIKNCFKKAGIVREASERENIDELEVVEESEEIMANMLDNLPGDYAMDEWDDFEGFEPWEVDAAYLVTSQSEERGPSHESIARDSEDEEEEEPTEEPIMTNMQAIAALEHLKKYAYSKGIDPKLLDGFELAMNDSMINLPRQAQITDFFAPRQTD